MRAFADVPSAVRWLHDPVTRPATPSSHITRMPSGTERIASVLRRYLPSLSARVVWPLTSCERRTDPFSVGVTTPMRRGPMMRHLSVPLSLAATSMHPHNQMTLVWRLVHPTLPAAMECLAFRRDDGRVEMVNEHGMGRKSSKSSPTRRLLFEPRSDSKLRCWVMAGKRSSKSGMHGGLDWWHSARAAQLKPLGRSQWRVGIAPL